MIRDGFLHRRLAGLQASGGGNFFCSEISLPDKSLTLFHVKRSNLAQINVPRETQEATAQTSVKMSIAFLG